MSDIYWSLVSSSLVDPAEYLPKATAAARTALALGAGFDPLRSDPRFQALLRRVGLAH